MSRLVMENVSRQFGGVFALRGASLEVRPGEVHGLLGANGSGKSTLIKVLAGFHTPEPGASLTVAGERLEPPVAEADLRRLGIAFVHQDLALFSRMSVVDNLRVAELTAGGLRHISWRGERRRAQQVLTEYGLGDVDPRASIESLSRTDRARLAIARAFVAADCPARTAVEGAAATTPPKGGLVVLDEPTAFLPLGGAMELFRLIRAFVARGGAVVFVSHNLDEVCEITDRVTVLRDGVVSGVRETKSVSADELVNLIVGRVSTGSPSDEPATSVASAIATAVPEAEIASAAPDAGEKPWLQKGTADVSVDGLRGGHVDGVSFDIRRGEVVGVAGLVGSGVEDLPYLLFGALPADAGTVRIGTDVLDARHMTPIKAVATGVALVPVERPTLGVFNELSLDDNLSPTVLGRYQRRGLLRRRRLREDARRLLEEGGVKPPAPGAIMRNLSGGNQQKVVMTKWTRRAPALLILHEPTQGVDVGARREIYRRLLDARDQRSTLCVSTDHDELELLCDRVLIFRRGKIVASLSGADIEKARISEACMRASDRAETATGRDGGA